jgi:hypothetical protein
VNLVELKAFLLKELAGLLGLLDTVGSEVDVVPASEPVLEVPGGLAVTDKDYFVNSLGSAHLK